MRSLPGCRPLDATVITRYYAGVVGADAKFTKTVVREICKRLLSRLR